MVCIAAQAIFILIPGDRLTKLSSRMHTVTMPARETVLIYVIMIQNRYFNYDWGTIHIKPLLGMNPW